MELNWQLKALNTVALKLSACGVWWMVLSPLASSKKALQLLDDQAHLLKIPTALIAEAEAEAEVRMQRGHLQLFANQ